MPTNENTDSKYMSLALRLAELGEGVVSPNPLVGAALVKDGEIVGKGYHRKAGLPHAEIEAFSDAEKKGRALKSSTLYVTLEPCCHQDKRTPPCTDAIIEKGISRVVVGTLDPNPEVSGKGVEILKQKGIDVTVGVLEEKCKQINEIFFKYITTGLPFVILKLAATLDGKIASSTGDSKWIGSENQRKRAHGLRNKVDAVLVGIETVIRDDPRLDVRLDKKTVSQPLPIVLDSRLRIPSDSRLLKVHESPIIASTPLGYPARAAELKKMGARILTIDFDENGHIDLNKLAYKLGEMEITSVLVEGGSRVAASAIRCKIADKVVFFYAPKIIGADGTSMIGNLGITQIKEAITFSKIKVRCFGDEFMIEGYI